MLSTDLASPALHRDHSVISDVRPPSVAESGEAALRRLLASRVIGGYSLTSDDPTAGRYPCYSHREFLDLRMLLKLRQLSHC